MLVIFLKNNQVQIVVDQILYHEYLPSVPVAVAVVTALDEASPSGPFLSSDKPSTYNSKITMQNTKFIHLFKKFLKNHYIYPNFHGGF